MREEGGRTVEGDKEDAGDEEEEFFSSLLSRWNRSFLRTVKSPIAAAIVVIKKKEQEILKFLE